MMMSNPEIDVDEFDNKYPPAEGLPPSSEYDAENQPGIYGWRPEDAAILAGQNPRCLWTHMDGDYGTYMVSGLRFVNRNYYFVSSVPRPSDEPEEYCIHTEEQTDEE